jgi:hypothetical protein
MIVKDSEERITLEEIALHPWMAIAAKTGEFTLRPMKPLIRSSAFQFIIPIKGLQKSRTGMKQTKALVRFNGEGKEADHPELMKRRVRPRRLIEIPSLMRTHPLRSESLIAVAHFS